MHTDKRIVWDIQWASFKLKPDDQSDRAWRGYLRHREYIPLLKISHPYALLAMDLKSTAAGERLWDFGERIEKITIRINLGFVPRGVNANHFIITRSSFLSQLIEEVEQYATENIVGVTFNPNRVAYVVTWMFNVMEHFLDGGGIHVVPHFAMFMEPTLNILTFEEIVARINWMCDEYNNTHRIMEQFLGVRGITMNMWSL